MATLSPLNESLPGNDEINQKQHHDIGFIESQRWQSTPELNGIPEEVQSRPILGNAFFSTSLRETTPRITSMHIIAKSWHCAVPNEQRCDTVAVVSAGF